MLLTEFFDEIPDFLVGYETELGDVEVFDFLGEFLQVFGGVFSSFEGTEEGRHFCQEFGIIDVLGEFAAGNGGEIVELLNLFRFQIEEIGDFGNESVIRGRGNDRSLNFTPVAGVHSESFRKIPESDLSANP